MLSCSQIKLHGHTGDYRGDSYVRHTQMPWEVNKLQRFMLLNTFNFFHTVNYIKNCLCRFPATVWGLSSDYRENKTNSKNWNFSSCVLSRAVCKLMFSLKTCLHLHFCPSANIHKLWSAWVIWNPNWSRRLQNQCQEAKKYYSASQTCRKSNYYFWKWVRHLDVGLE